MNKFFATLALVAGITSGAVSAQDNKQPVVVAQSTADGAGVTQNPDPQKILSPGTTGTTIPKPNFGPGFSVTFKNTAGNSSGGQETEGYTYDKTENSSEHVFLKSNSPDGRNVTNTTIKVTDLNRRITDSSGVTHVVEYFRWPLVPGDTWSGEVREHLMSGSPARLEYSVKTGAMRTVTVQAGTFNIVPIDVRWKSHRSAGVYSGDVRYWYAPELGWYVQLEWTNYSSTSRVLSHKKYELTNFSRGNNIQAAGQ